MTATTTTGTLAHATSAGYGEWRSDSPMANPKGNADGLRFDVRSASIAA